MKRKNGYGQFWNNNIGLLSLFIGVICEVISVYLREINQLQLLPTGRRLLLVLFDHKL